MKAIVIASERGLLSAIIFAADQVSAGANSKLAVMLAAKDDQREADNHPEGTNLFRRPER